MLVFTNHSGILSSVEVDKSRLTGMDFMVMVLYIVSTLSSIAQMRRAVARLLHGN